MTQITIDHYLQRDILRSLSRNSRLSFSSLKPDGVENGMFSYHLKRLLNDGLIRKHVDTYGLSNEGMRYVSWVTRTNLDIVPQPKIFCLLLIQNEAGELAMIRRHAEPFIGRYTLPGGVLYYSENTSAVVDRQLHEKIGFEVAMTNRGLASLKLSQDGQLVSHIYAHLFYGTVKEHPELHAKDVRFAPQWIDPANLVASELLPDVKAIVNKVASTPEYFFFDLSVDEPGDQLS